MRHHVAETRENDSDLVSAVRRKPVYFVSGLYLSEQPQNFVSDENRYKSNTRNASKSRYLCNLHSGYIGMHAV